MWQNFATRKTLLNFTFQRMKLSRKDEDASQVPFTPKESWSKAECQTTRRVGACVDSSAVLPSSAPWKGQTPIALCSISYHQFLTATKIVRGAEHWQISSSSSLCFEKSGLALYCTRPLHLSARRAPELQARTSSCPCYGNLRHQISDKDHSRHSWPVVCP